LHAAFREVFEATGTREIPGCLPQSRENIAKTIDYSGKTHVRSDA
jgi:hypothetical protein